jgi:hypothetical protein
MTRDEWCKHLKVATQEEKDGGLFHAMHSLNYEAMTILIKAGAKLKGGEEGNMFSSVLRKTEDVGSCNAMLDGGWTCERVTADDVWHFYEDDDKDLAYKTLGRMLNAGIDAHERLRIAAAVLKRGEYEYLDTYIVLPDQDMKRLAQCIDISLQKVYAGDVDRRQLTPEDIEKYVAWHNTIGDLYAASFGNGITEQKLKDTVTKDGMTGFMLAVRVGKMDAVVDYYRANPDKSLDADDMLKEDKYGQSVVSLLGQKQELQKLFGRELWKTAPEDALDLLSNIPAMYKDYVDPVAVAKAAAESRQVLRRDAKTAATPLSGAEP